MRINRILATAGSLALLVPGTALAAKPESPGKGKGKATAPGQVCKSLKVKGKKTAEQRAAYKQCIKDAVDAKRKQHAASDDDAE